MSDTSMQRHANREIVLMLRDAAADVTGGNCAFADDDLAILTHLAHRAVRAGLTDRLNPQIVKRLARRRGDLAEGRCEWCGRKPSAVAEGESATPERNPE